MRIPSILKSLEPFLFGLVVVLTAIPVVTLPVFPTLDGPAHAYNAQLIGQFWNNSLIPQFYSWSPEWVPNWMGHFLLAILQRILPESIAEKTFLLLYFIGLPYAFRWSIFQLQPRKIWVSYLLFPFIYSFVFLLGFYNFSFGFIFMFLAIGTWAHALKNQSFSVITFLFLFIFLLSTYFSHLVVFGITLLVLGLMSIFGSLGNSFGWVDYFKKHLYEWTFLFLTSSIPVILMGTYFLNHPNEGTSQKLNSNLLIDWLYNCRGLVAYNFLDEQHHTTIIGLTLISLSAVGLLLPGSKVLFNWVYSKDSFWKPLVHTYLPFLPWLCFSVIILVLYFTLPNAFGGGSFISVRFNLILFISSLFILAYIKFPKAVQIGAVCVVLWHHFQLEKQYYSELKRLSNIAQKKLSKLHK